jgi:hypothetical protein
VPSLTGWALCLQRPQPLLTGIPICLQVVACTRGHKLASFR